MLGQLAGGWFEAALFIVGMVVVVHHRYFNGGDGKVSASTAAGIATPAGNAAREAGNTSTGKVLTKEERRAARAAAGARMGEHRSRKKTPVVPKPQKKAPHPETDKVRSEV